MLGGEACARLPWNISTVPGLPVGATMPMPPGGAASSHSRVTVCGSSVHSGYDVVLWSWAAARVRCLWLVEKDRDVHGARLGHAVVAGPGAVVLVPLPDVALERRLGVDLELVDVDALAEQLHERLDQARMVRHQPERLVVGVGGKG